VAGSFGYNIARQAAQSTCRTTISADQFFGKAISMNIVVVGASGVVGVAVQKELANHGHQLRCVDLGPPACEMSDLLELFGYDPTPPEAEWIYKDILSPGMAEAALKDMDACVYVTLANPTAENALLQYSVNLAAPRQLAEASFRGNHCKLIYASTVSVHIGPEGHPCTELDPPEPWGDYAMSKWLAEEMLRIYSQKRGLRAICLRLGTVHPHIRTTLSTNYFQYFIDVRDVARAFRLAAEDTRIQFDVLQVVSRGEPERCSPARAREMLGFEAQYNGAEHFLERYRKSIEFREKHPAPARPGA
jgi:nucleoside-diphosphate-sugar epimerase